jgi:hypothetical protein
MYWNEKKGKYYENPIINWKKIHTINSNYS